MSLRPCIAKLSTNFWASRSHARPVMPTLRRIDQRPVITRPLPLELRETISLGVIKQLTGFHNELKVALEKRKLDDVLFSLTSSRRVFFTLPKVAWEYVRASHLRLTLPEVEQVAGILIKRGKKKGAEALGQLLQDAKAMYGVDPTPELLFSALNALARTGQQTDAFDLLMRFVNYKKPPFRPNSKHWRSVMWGLALSGDVERLKECLSIMKGSWPFPGNTHYHALLEGFSRRVEPLSIDEVRQYMDEMQKFKFPYDVVVHNTLVRLSDKFAFAGLPSEYVERCNSQTRPTDAQMEEWLEELIKYRSRAKAAFELKLKNFRHEGFIPNDSILTKLVRMRSLSSHDEMLYLQDILELNPGVITWTICMRNALEKNGWRAGIAVYNTARTQGVRPDSAMIHPLLRAMCNKTIQEPPEAIVDKALDLYGDLQEEAKASAKPGADTGIFNTLLRALAANRNRRKYFPIALRLLEDMRSQGVYMDRMTTTSVAVLLVRSSLSYEEAAEVYKRVYSINAEGVDQKGHAAVLHAFCSLEPDPLPSEKVVEEEEEESTGIQVQNGTSRAVRRLSIPPAELYFQIVRDMQSQGLKKTEEVYTILLGRYAALGTRARNIRSPTRREFLVRTIRAVIKETHRQISVDAGLEPDAPLLNQLMDAYNRVGLFRDAMQVWTMLTSTRLVSNASVSIVFDACGHCKESEKADAIFHDLKERGFQLNRRNWHSWVECLCRLGRLDEALKFVCADLKNEVDEKAVQVLLSFASAYGRSDEVRSCLKTHIPHLCI